MKSAIQRLILLFALSALELVSTSAFASHFRFANLSWKRAPGTNALAVEITLTEAWQRFDKGTISYSYGDGSGSFDSSAAVLTATLADQAGEQYEVWRYTTIHTYPSNGVFTVSGNSCCRISSLANAGDASERLSMVIDLRNNNSGSPVTAAPVILQMQAGTNNSIALPIVDPDGDAYQVRMATVAESSIPNIPQVGTNTLTVTSGGVLNWNTVGGFAQQKFAVQVIIEENRAGNTTGINGLVPLDFIIELVGTLTNRAPTVVGTNGTITLLPNQRFSTTLTGTDPEGGPLVVSHQGLPPGAVITPADGSTNASPASVTFTWTPTLADVGSSYAVLIFLRDQGGLQAVQSFALTVGAGVLVNDFDLISVRAIGPASGSGASLNPVLSTNGQFVAFVSDATNLVAGDLNGRRDVFWRDRGAGVTRLVSRSLSGVSGNGESESPSISPDGRYVAFHSRASNLAAGDTNSNYDVFVWDAQTDTVTLVSRTAAGLGGAGDSFAPKLSANGRLVAFLSTAGDLAGPDTNNTSDVFRFNLDTSVMTLVSVNLNLTSGNGSCGVPVMSADGRHVAFLSRASDLVTNDFNTQNDVFVRDLQSGVTRLVSVNAAGTGSGNRLSLDPVISADGRFIAFGSQATDLVALPDTNNFPDVFLRDMQLEVTRLVSVNRLGTASGGTGGAGSVLPASFNPFLSADGTKVLFSSLAEDLVAGDTNRAQDVFLYDVAGQTNALISINKFGTGAGNGASGVTPQSLSADGRYVAFFSDASDIGAADLNGRTDVFLRDLSTNQTKIISRARVGGLAGNGNSYQPAMSADGVTVLFTSEASNLVPNDSNQTTDIFTAASALGAPDFGPVNLALSAASISAQTVGTSFNVVLSATNLSANPATGVRVALSIPGAVTVTSASPSQGSINTSGTDWQLGDLASGATATLTLTMNPLSLGIAPLSASVSQIDQPDTEPGNNSLTATITIDRTAAGAVFHLPGGTAYLSRTNSPFFAGLLSGAFTLESFERGSFEMHGVTATAGVVSPPGGTTDSVDADDGAVDGSGTAGRSFLVASTNAVTFSFDPLRLGRLPTKVGIVLTDGNDAGAGIEAYDLNGVSLGVIGPFVIGDLNSTGETDEDRFLGTEFAGGISALRVYYPTAGFELDHLQFDVPTTDLALSGVAPTNATFGTSFTVTLTVTNRGPVVATGVIVTNADPGGDVTFLGAVSSQGTVDAQGTWTVGSLAVGGSASFSATVVSAGSGFLLFRAGVRSAVPDAHLGNDTVNLGVLVTNTAPSLVFATNMLTLLEDSSALSYPAFFRGHAPESNQFITNLSVSVDNPGLFAVAPAIAPNGTLTFTPALNATGTATVSVLATDNGGTLNGGVATGSNSFTIVVTPVNDAPSFAFATNILVVLEDSLAQTNPAFATFGTGDLGQAITNVVTTNSNPALFAVQPQFTVDGTLRFTPATNANGSATVAVYATDNGGTADGGVNTSATNTFTITLTPVNDAPVLTLAISSLGVAEDIGLTTFSNLVATLNPGPTNEAAQTRIGSYVVTNSNPALFDSQPSVDANGTLTFQGATNATGTITVGVTAQDSGGTAAGGVDLGTATFLLILQERNDPPTFSFATNNVVVLEDSGAATVAGFIASSSVGPVQESGLQAITNYFVTAATTNLFAVQPAIGVNGTLTFTPAANAFGTTAVTVVARDNGGNGNSGESNSAPQSFTLTILAVNDAPGFTLTAGTATDGVQDWVRDATAITSSGVKVITDGSGNLIVAGDEVVVAGEVNTYKVRLVKYSNAGVAQWTNLISANSLNINSSVQARGLAVDSTGAVLVTGVFSDGGTDFLTMKFAADGSLVWSNRFDSLANDEPMAVVVDGNNKVIVAGKSEDGSHTDYLTIKYLADGTPFWTNRSSYSGLGNDVAKSVAVDAAGDVYVTGDGSDTDYTYVYTLKLAAATGVPVWTNRFDLAGENSTAEAVRVDGTGNVIVAGTLNDTNSRAYFGVVKYSGAGAVVWTNLYARNTSAQHVHGLAVDSAGNVIITGNTEVSVNMDFTTIKYLADGTPAWTNHYDGAALGRDHPNAIAVNAAGEVFVTGDSAGDNSTDWVTVKYTAAGVGVWTNRYDGNSQGNDKPAALAVDSGTNVFVTGAADGVMRTLKYALVPADGANQTVFNSVGAVSVSGFIVGTSVGPANEAAQTVSFLVTNSNPGLFAVQPALNAAGVLTYTVDAAALGLAVVTVQAQDTGGTANGGVDTSAGQSFNLTVLQNGAVARTFLWTNTMAGAWHNAANWSPRGVPNVLDTAQLFTDVTVQLTNAVTVASLELAAGAVDGAGSLTVRSSMTWSGGTMSGAGTTTIASGGTLTISGAVDKDLRRRLDNFGTVTWTAGRILGHDSAVIHNRAGAVFEARGDGNLFESFDGSPKTFNNAGTVRKSTATGTSSWEGVLNNTGVLELQRGTLFLANDYAPAAGSTLRVFLGGLTAGTQFGRLQVGGTATLNGTLNIVTNGFVPVAANSFLVVSGGTRVGTFAAVTGDNLGGGLTLVPTYVLGNLTLVATDGSAALPPLAPGVDGGSRVIRWPAGTAGYELQTAPTVFGPWTPVLAPVAAEDGASVVRLSADGTRFYRLVQPTPRPGDNPAQ